MTIAWLQLKVSSVKAQSSGPICRLNSVLEEQKYEDIAA